MIKKSECVATLDIRDKAAYDAFVAIFDERLKKYSRGGKIHIDIPSNVTHKVVERIIAEYTTSDAGWKVDSGYDQRDGSWLAFS